MTNKISKIIIAFDRPSSGAGGQMLPMRSCMKKAVSFLLVLFLLLSDCAAASAAPNATAIRDVEGLLAIREDPSGSYTLEADIDMGGISWKPVAFSGKLDGKGHTLYNLTVTSCGDEVRTARDGNLKAYDTVFAGLFSVLEDAVVKNLNLKGGRILIESSEHCFAGGITGYMDNASISGCKVETRIYLINYAVMTGIGGIAGFGCGKISDCAVDTELVFEDRNTNSRCEQFMGGVLACGAADIDNNFVSVHGYDSCSGYVHDGGLVGMYYACGMQTDANSVCDNVISGYIRFFENNPDRRAYCGPAFGEYLHMPYYFHGNTDGFSRLETWDYDTVLSPETCDSPDYAESVMQPDCSSWGFTTRTCKGCGYTIVENYTAPRHTPGVWVIVKEPTYEKAGSERICCTVCGKEIEMREIPALIASVRCSLDQHSALLATGDTLSLKAEVLPADATAGTVIWTSSDTAVARVDENGIVTATGKGRAVIRAQTEDGFAADSCEVTVTTRMFRKLLSLLR